MAITAWTRECSQWRVASSRRSRFQKSVGKPGGTWCSNHIRRESYRPGRADDRKQQRKVVEWRCGQ